MRKLPVTSVAVEYFLPVSVFVAVMVTPGSGVPAAFFPEASAIVAEVTMPVMVPPCTSCGAVDVWGGAPAGRTGAAVCACSMAAPRNGKERERRCHGRRMRTSTPQKNPVTDK
jgi:hypothetical protein